MYSNDSVITEDLDTLEGILEDFEYDESDESDQSDLSERRRRRWNYPPTATGGRLYQPRPMSQYVTQTQLQAALTRVSSQIKTNSDAIKTVNTRLNSVSAEQSRQAALLKKEISERKKQDLNTKREIQQKLQLLILLPLLIKPPSKAITINNETVNVLVESNDTLSLLLPLLLVGGLGGDGMSLSGSGSIGGLDTTTLILILALSGNFGSKK
ncbi:MAG: hypothetical protein IGS39_00435 [Calothrix sp. C42_A2020_038]|nr:hypothetical protein [Calothrix sp. C42_A2020_038]